MSAHNLSVDSSQVRALVVDDDITMRMLARKSLEKAGFQALEAATGAEGLEIVRSQRLDIVLLDVEMPEMDGFTTCQKIRQLPGGENLPVLMITGLEDVDSITRAYEAGATDFVTKPVNWPILEYRVRYVLRASKAFERVKESEAGLARAQSIASLGNWTFECVTDDLWWSEEVYRIFGVSSNAFSINHEVFFECVHDDDKHLVRQAISAALHHRQPYNIEFRIRPLAGKGERFVHQQGEVILDSMNRAVRIAGTLQDITQRKVAEEKIRRLAYYDNLTGLPNRQSLQELLDQALCLAKRNDRRIALLFLDLDNFKRINDTLGHSLGDLLLKTVAERLLECVRESDVISRSCEGDATKKVARLGGDEFTVLLSEIREAGDAAVVAQRIQSALSEPIMLDGHKVFTTPSIGIAVYPHDGNNVGALLKNADMAMYHAKESGKGNFQFYMESMNTRAHKRLGLDSELRGAIDRRELALYYQPLVDLQSCEIVGAEALMRWHSRKMGMVPPDEFIPIAEDNGMIIEMGRWALETACAQQKNWQKMGLGPIRIAVNISSAQFRHGNLTQSIEGLLKDCALDPRYLVLELTESMIMENAEKAVADLHQLKNMGLGLSVDDFGTGYSSLNYLKRFPISSLKIDRSFVADITDDPDDTAIIDAIIALGHSLKLRIIAEGVETEEQQTYLRAKGCDEMQGYLISKPVPAEDFAQLLRNRHPLPDTEESRRIESVSR